MIRLLTAIAAVGLATTAADAAPMLHKAATQQRYLYVACSQRFGKATVLRYPFAGRFPAAQPDLTYDGVGAQITVDRNGSLYASVPLSSFGRQTVDVFAPDSNVLSRQITMPNLKGEDYTDASALVVGEYDHLFAAYYGYISGLATAATGDDFPNPGFAVYRPNANGSGRPAKTFTLRTYFPYTMTFGPDGDLYLGTGETHLNTTAVVRVHDPLHNPHVVDVLRASPFNGVTGLAFSDGGTFLYTMLSIEAFYAEVAVYPYGAKGHAKPARELVLPEYSGGSLAIEGRYLYTANSLGSPFQIVAYEKYATGSPPPAFTLNLPSDDAPEGIAIGP